MPFFAAWPFSCDQLIPCQDVPYQTCGCKNLQGTEDLAIVYNLNAAGGRRCVSMYTVRQ
jgi:hypothetical protein